MGGRGGEANLILEGDAVEPLIHIGEAVYSLHLPEGRQRADKQSWYIGQELLIPWFVRDGITCSCHNEVTLHSDCSLCMP